jgi:hypothetical protein
MGTKREEIALRTLNRRATESECGKRERVIKIEKIRGEYGWS